MKHSICMMLERCNSVLDIGYPIKFASFILCVSSWNTSFLLHDIWSIECPFKVCRVFHQVCSGSSHCDCVLFKRRRWKCANGSHSKVLYNFCLINYPLTFYSLFVWAQKGETSKPRRVFLSNFQNVSLCSCCSLLHTSNSILYKSLFCKGSQHKPRTTKTRIKRINTSCFSCKIHCSFWDIDSCSRRSCSRVIRKETGWNRTLFEYNDKYMYRMGIMCRGL